MTKADLEQHLTNGNTLDYILRFRNGIYKSRKFYCEDDNDIVYIPDITLLNISTGNELHKEEIEEVIEHCYTCNDFLEITKSHLTLAIDLWNYVSGQIPNLDDFLEGYDKNEFLNDYGFSMDELLNKKENSTDDSQRDIVESAIHITWIYTDLANDGKVYPLMSDEVNSCELMNFIADIATEFERIGNYDDWMTELDKYATERFMSSEYAIKKKIKIKVTETYEKVYEIEAENFDKAVEKMDDMFLKDELETPSAYNMSTWNYREYTEA